MIMANTSVTIRAHLMVPGGTNLPMPVTLTYDESDPFTVIFQFSVASTTVPWHVSRDLLKSGLSDDAGLGDVRVWPSSEEPDIMYMSLSSPEGEALIEFDTELISNFLLETYEICALGSEESMLDWDAEIMQLLMEG